METMRKQQETESSGSCCTIDGLADHQGHEGHDHQDSHQHHRITSSAMADKKAHAVEDHSRHGQHAASPKESNFRLAVAATLHCLIGCGIGEIVGVIIGTALGLDMWTTMGLGLFLGAVFGLALGVMLLLRGGFEWKAALRMVLVSEGLSIVVMESAEALVQVYTPGVMMAGLTDSIFWIGMGFALAAGFLAALPVNAWLVSRGIRHAH